MEDLVKAWRESLARCCKIRLNLEPKLQGVEILDKLIIKTPSVMVTLPKFVHHKSWMTKWLKFGII